MSDLIPSDIVTINTEIITRDTLETSFGKYIKKSRICPICIRHDHMEVNQLRARDHLTYHEIVSAKNVTIDALRLHFKSHFIISKNNQQLLDLKENSSEESNEIVQRILEGEVDFFGGAMSVLQSKIQRLKPIQDRISTLSDDQEIDNLDDIEKQEYILLNKLAEGIENSIMNVHQLMDKKLFPSDKEDLAKATLSYKLSVLSKFVDDIVIVLLEFEKNPQYTELVRQIRRALSQRVSALETLILKSGGEIKAIEVGNGGND